MAITQFYINSNGVEFVIAKVSNNWEVYNNGKFTGYKFRSYKKAVEYCEFGF